MCRFNNEFTAGFTAILQLIVFAPFCLKWPQKHVTQQLRSFLIDNPECTPNISINSMFEEPHNPLFYPKRLSMNPNLQVQIMWARCLYYSEMFVVY